jgi:hypothetical protein
MINISEYEPNLIKSEIISCSRRTDIPAFLMDWVISKIQVGYVDVVNPFNRKQISRVSLSPEHVKAWVWWSKNFHEWIKVYQANKSLFNAYKGHLFQFTINSPSELEKGISVSLEERFKQSKWLIDTFGISALSFRFDPIIFYKKKGSDELKNNLDKFEYIIDHLSKYGINDLIFSFATIYNKVQSRMNYRGFIPIELHTEQKQKILTKLIEICSMRGIKMKACCQPELMSMKGISQAHCIDANKIETIIGEPIEKVRDSGQRKYCGCYKSKDIGGYTGIFRCKHNCAYCYASPAKK